MISPFALPPPLRASLAGHTWQRITIGESRAGVFHLNAPGQADMVLKAQVRDPLFPLQGEADRMRWLHGRIPVPRVIDFIQDSERDYLLMTALPGQDAATAKLPPGELIAILADALRRLHAVETAGCPFRHAIGDCVAESKAMLDAGRVNVGNFDPENQGREPSAIFAELNATRPADETCVFTHGDFCLPNVIIAAGQLSGFVDLGRAGAGDPYP